MSSPVVFSREVVWLLRDKYHVDPAHIAAFQQNSADLARQPWVKDLEWDNERLAAGEPLAYVIGWTPFLGAQIGLEERPLIPRPETEYWVEKCLRQMPTNTPLRVLDLCCGSGCMGIAVLQHRPLAQVTFADIDERALKQTQQNLQRNHIVATRARVVASDLWQQLTNERFDFILANPPYVDKFGEYSPLLQWEPEQALFAQDNGFELINQILIDAENHLFSTGELWLEFGHEQAKRIQSVVREKTPLRVEILPDQFGKERVARVTQRPNIER